MALPAGDLVLYSIGGAISSDTWSVNVWVQLIGMDGVPTVPQLQASAAARLASFRTQLWAASASPLGGVNAPAVTLSTCKATAYTNGGVVQSATAVISPVAGSGVTVHAPYTALVATLRTGFAGRSRRGRIYMPWTGGAFNAALLVADSMATHAGNVAAFMNALGPEDTTLPGAPASHAVVVSRTHALASPITSVEVNNKADTQRLRENGINATSVASATVT